MPGKKTGLYLSPIAEEIVNEVAEKYGYTKISNTINFIVMEYSKLIKQENAHRTDKQEITVQDANHPVQPVEEEPQRDFSGWFVAEDKQ